MRNLFLYCLSLALCASSIQSRGAELTPGWNIMNPDIPGTDDVVRAMVWKNGNLYVGGDFKSVKNFSAKGIAKWSGSEWSAIGEGFSGEVHALAFDAVGNLYAGGWITITTPKGSTRGGVATWDGVAWSLLGAGVDRHVRALAFDAAGNLYAGGDFTSAGGVACNHIAKWDGTSWSPLGKGLELTKDPNAEVTALLFNPAGELFAGGHFDTAGGEPARHVAKWDGTIWSPLGDGLEETAFRSVYALAFDAAGNLCAGGNFICSFGETKQYYLAKWDGNAWSSLGGGIQFSIGYSVRSLAADAKGALYVGGVFSTAGDAPCGNIAKWDGTTWTPLETGTDHAVNALAFDETGSLYAGGEFFFAGSQRAHYTAKWDGAAWSLLGKGMNGAVETIAHDAAGNIYSGGYFDHAGEAAAKHVATWDGSRWTPLGEGMNDAVYALLCVDGVNVYAGGAFTTAGGVDAKHIAKWDGQSWSPLAKGTSDPVNVLASDAAGNLYAGWTSETSPAYHLGRWDGTAWTPIAAVDFSYICSLMCDASGNLYAGGYVLVGDIYYGRVGRWDGKTWTYLDNGLQDARNWVRAIAFDPAGNLYAGLNSSSDEYCRVVKWSGNSWLPFGANQMSGQIYTMAFDASGNLYAGGWRVGSGTSYGVVRWNGVAWHSLGSILNDSVYAFDFDTLGNLHAGGSFTQIGGLFTPYIACWKGGSLAAEFSSGTGGALSTAPSATTGKIFQTVDNGGDCTAVTAVPNAGYEFACWTGDILSTENPLLLTSMTTDVAVTAKFIIAGSAEMNLRKVSMSSIYTDKLEKDRTEWSVIGTDKYELTIEFTPPAGFAPSWLNKSSRVSYTFGRVSQSLTLGDGTYKDSPKGGSSVITLTQKSTSAKTITTLVVTTKWDAKSIKLSVKGTPPGRSYLNIVDLIGSKDGEVAGELRDINVQLGAKLWWSADCAGYTIPYAGTRKTVTDKRVPYNLDSWKVKGGITSP